MRSSLVTIRIPSPSSLAVAACYLCSSTILRIVLYIQFGVAASVSFGSLPIVVLIGFLNDLIVTLYLLFFLRLIDLLYAQLSVRYKAFASIGFFFLWLSFFAILYLQVVQYYFFKEYDARFNLVAVDYLIYPHEVLINIWESYPVSSALAVTAGLSSLLLWRIIPWLRANHSQPTSMQQQGAAIVAHGLLVLLLANLFSTHTFDFSANRVANELIADGVSSFVQAFHTNHLDYSQFYLTGKVDDSQRILQNQLAQGSENFIKSPDHPWLQRDFKEQRNGFGKLNVVVITEESFGCEQIDTCSKGLDIATAVRLTPDKKTPYFNALAEQGMFFTSAYATGTRTVRGLEAISASFPPIPSESIIKRPGNDHIATWGKVMQENGYSTSFLYGGYGQFDNMNTYFSGNGFEVRDRLAIGNPRFTNIWGVSDQDLFDYSRQYFDKQAESGKPFFAILMTTSNHSPFTFPAGIPGVPEKGGGRNAGIRYADYALGEFFAKAKDQSWFANTLFIVTADHGARVYGKAQIPLNSYEIPLLIYSPNRVHSQQISRPISQMDIAPTVLGLLGLPYSAPFFGQNVFTEDRSKRVLLFNHNHDVALYQNKRLVVLGLQKSVATYSCTLGENEFVKIPEDVPLSQLAAAYYQTAFELFQNHTYR